METAKRIEKVELKDNDIVLIRVFGLTPSEKKAEIEEKWTKIFEQQGYKNIKVILLHESVEIEILTKSV